MEEVKIETHQGEAIYEAIRERLGEDVLQVYFLMEIFLEDQFGRIQIISEPYELEDGTKGLECLLVSPCIFRFEIVKTLEGKVQLIEK